MYMQTYFGKVCAGCAGMSRDDASLPAAHLGAGILEVAPAPAPEEISNNSGQAFDLDSTQERSPRLQPGWHLSV